MTELTRYHRRKLDQSIKNMRRADDTWAVLRGTMSHEEFARKYEAEDAARLARHKRKRRR